jgi:hypothetical protein
VSLLVGKLTSAQPGTETEREEEAAPPVGKRNAVKDVSADPAALSVRAARGALRRLRALGPALGEEGTDRSAMIAVDARGALGRADLAIAQLQAMAFLRPELAGDLTSLLADRAALAPAVERAQGPAAWRREAAPMAARLGLGDVDVRSDDQARAITDAKSARGVALGGTVYMHPERVQPGTDAGREVLAHELLHLAQARLPGREADLDDRAAAELEAAALAPDLAGGGLARAPERPIDLSRPAADSDAAAFAAWKKFVDKNYDAAWKFFHVNYDKFLAAFADQLAKLPLPAHARLKWIGNLGTGFVEAVNAIVAKSPYRFIEIKELIRPIDPMRIIDQNRDLSDGLPGKPSGVGKDPIGPLWWNPMTGAALAIEVAKVANLSLARMLPRYLVQADEKHPAVVEVTDLVASSPMDEVMARMLCNPKVLGTIGAPARSCAPGKKREPDAPGTFRQGPRFLNNWRWLGEKDGRLWNWVEAIDPMDATTEEVAVSIWGDLAKSSRADLITKSGRFFRVHPGYAHTIADAVKYAPKDGKDWYKPQDDNALALAESTIAFEAAISSADGEKKLKVGEAADPERIQGYKKTLEKSKRQLARMFQQLQVAPLRELVLPALNWVERYLDAIFSFSAERYVHLQAIIDGQQQLLFTIAGEVDTLTNSGYVPLEHGGPLVDVLREYAIAAGESFLLDSARAHFGRAKAKQATLALDSADALLNDARAGVADLNASEHGWITYGGTDAKAQLNAQQQQLHAMRAKHAAGGQIDAGEMELATAKLRELQFLSQTRALYVKIKSLAETARDVNNDAMEVIANAFHGDIRALPGKLYGILSEISQVALSPYEEFQRNETQMAWSEEAKTPSARARRIGDALHLAQTRLSKEVLAKHDLKAIFERAKETIQDAQLYTLILQIILLVAVSVAGGVAGSIVGGAVRGAVLASTATRTVGMLRTVNAARALGTFANITADAAVNTVGQRAILGKDGDSFLYNLASNAAVLAALRPLHSAAAAWKVAENVEWKSLDMWNKVKVGGQIAFKTTTVVTAEMITAAAVSYAMERAVKGPPKDEATAIQWIIQGASMAFGRFVSGRMAKVEERLGKLAMQDTAAWVRMRRVQKTAKDVEKAGDPQKAIDIAVEHTKVLDEEAAQLDSLLKSGKSKLRPGELEILIAGNKAEQRGVEKAALVPLQLQFAGLTADSASGNVWFGTTEQIAVALHNAARIGLHVKVGKRDPVTREWSVFLHDKWMTIVEAEPVGRPREAKDMTDAERAHALRYAAAADFMQKQWEDELRMDLHRREVIELDHLQVGYSIAGVMNQATLPSLGKDRGNLLVVYENRGTMSNRGQQEIGQSPKHWDAPGIRTSEQSPKDAEWARSADLDRALAIGRAELQTPAYQGRATQLERRPSEPTEDWKAPHRKFRVLIESGGEKRWFYTDRYDNAGGMGPGLVHDEVKAAAKKAGIAVDELMADNRVVLGDDPYYFEKLKAGEILVWGGSPTGAWAAEPGVHAPRSRVDVMGDDRPKPGEPKRNWNELVAEHESVMAKLAADPGNENLIGRKNYLEYELQQAHQGAALRRNTKPGATYADPHGKGNKVRIHYGTPTKIEALPDGRVRVEMRQGSTLISKEYDQIVLAHGQDPGAQGGPGALLGKGAPETAPGSREYGDVPHGTIALRPVYAKRPDGKDGDIVALESIDPPGIRLVGAAYAHPAMAPWIAKADRKRFLDWIKAMREEHVPTRDHGEISSDSKGVTPGIEHQRDKLPQANEAFAGKNFKLPGPKATLELRRGMTDGEIDSEVLRFLALHMRADGTYVSVQRLGGGKSEALVYLVKVGGHDAGVFKLFGHKDAAATEVAILDLLAASGLKHMKAVAARGMAGATPDSGFGSAMLMDTASGTSVRDLIKASGSDTDRAATMQKLQDAVVKVATGLGEMHTKFGQRNADGTPAMMTKENKQSDADYMVNRNFNGTGSRDAAERTAAIRNALGADFDRVKAAIDGNLRTKFYDAQVPATANLGDANAGNFMVSKHDAARGYQDLEVIDVGAAKWSFDGNPTVGAKGKGTGAADLARFLGSLETMFPGNLRPHEVQALRDKFMWAYLAQYKTGKSPGFQSNYADAEKWYRIELELTVLADPSGNQAATKKRIMTMLGLLL